METASLTIGELARQVGCNTSAIRFYESRGVLPRPERVGGQRRYTPEAVRRLQVLGVAKRAGFTLDEAKVLLAGADKEAHTHLRELAARKLPEVDALIAQAQAMRTWLTTATACTCQTLDVCGLFDVDATTPSAAAGRPAALNIAHACR